MGFKIEVSVDLSVFDEIKQRIASHPPWVLTDGELAAIATGLGTLAGSSYRDDVMSKRISPISRDIRSATGETEVSAAGQSLPIVDFNTRGFATGFLSEAVDGIGATIGSSGPTIAQRISGIDGIDSGIEYGINAASFASSFYASDDFKESYVLGIEGIVFNGVIGESVSAAEAPLIRISETGAQKVLNLMKSLVQAHIDEAGLPLTVQ